jgi:Winged helix DNA-binding domain
VRRTAGGSGIDIDIRAMRLGNQRIARSTFSTARDAVAWMGAVQAQEFWPAKWGVALRASGVTEADVDRELDAGRIVRTHILRPTWHFVAAEDIRWMLSISGPRVHGVSSYYYRKHGMTPALVARSEKVIARALEGRSALTRTELGERLTRARIELFENLLAHLVMHAELEGLICSGPRRGKQSTYMLLDERVPSTKVPSREEALAELARRYFTSHGPAKVQDFVWWSGMTARDTKIALDAIGGDIVAETCGSETYWMARSSKPATRDAGAVDLLPIYDEYLIAYRDRRAMAAPPRPGETREHDIFAHYLMIDGQVRGTWRKRDVADRIEIGLTPYGPLTRAQRRSARAVGARLASFAGRPVDLR